MSDSSRKTPPQGMKKLTRMQSQDERDAEGLAARREREAVVKESSNDEITGRYEGEQLDEKRNEREDGERFIRLEKKHDVLKKDVQKKHDELKGDVKELRGDVKELSSEFSILRSEVSGAVGKLDGQSGVLTEMLSIVKRTAEQTVEREHVSFTAKVEVDKAHELAQVEVAKEQQLAAIEVKKEEKVDTVKEKSDRRKRNLKLLGILASGGSIVELIHQLWERFS
jgi:hypothetical protein